MIRIRSLLVHRWLLSFFLAALVQFAFGQPLAKYATDKTNSITDSELAALEKKLSDFDKTTSTQILVLVVPRIESGSIEETALRVAEENGIGWKGKNNGALLFIAKDDRQIRIEVGYGLEGVLTDAISGQIIRGEIVPRFRLGKFFDGISAAVDAIIAVTKNEYTADPSERQSSGVNLLPFIMIIVVFLFISTQVRRRRFIGGGFPPIFFPGRGIGHGFGGWSGGGGFTGGGGSFGGGGASGRW